MKKSLIILFLVLILVNVFVIHNYGYFERRLIRLISICVYFLVFLFYKKVKNKNILSAFVALLTVDVLGLSYETGFISIIGPAIKLIGYAFIINEIIGKINIKGIKKPISLIFGAVILLNLFMVYHTVWTTFLKTEEYAESILYIVYGSINVLMIVLTLNYNSRYSSKHSIYYLYFVFGLILSDASWFIAYYLKSYSAFYLDILFYLLAYNFIILYSESKNLNKEDLIYEN